MLPFQNILLAGAGRVATHLGVALKANGFNILGIWNHNRDSAKELAVLLDVPILTSLENAEADLVIIAVTDDAIPWVSSLVPDHIACIHTSGSTAIDVLSQEKAGVLWPLQTFTKRASVVWDDLPICIEGNSPEMEDRLLELAQKLSTKVTVVDTEQRTQLHLAAVVSCNFTNALYSLSQQMLSDCNLNFSLLHKLIENTAKKATLISPLEAQTGPAARRDTGIINQQLQQLHDKPLWQELYASLTELIIRQQNGKEL